MKSKFVTGGALAALAAGLALIAVPAQARPKDDDNYSQRHENSGQRQRPADAGQRSHDRGQAAVPARQAAPLQVAQQGRQQDRGHWQGQRGNAPQARQQEPQRTWNQPARQLEQRGADRGERAQGWDGNRRETRNGTYVDPNRNTGYRGNDRNWQGNRDDNRRDNRTWQGNRGGNDRSYRDGHRDNRHWDRNWRSNNRYDWQRYRSANRNVYHLGRYYAPYRNYSYRRLSIGFSLDPLFFGSDYWIGDPGYYRLPAVYGPYRWVRYYDDALLVDIYSGEVVDAIYDFFW